MNKTDAILVLALMAVIIMSAGSSLTPFLPMSILPSGSMTGFGVCAQYYRSDYATAVKPDMWTIAKYLGVSVISGAVRRNIADQAVANGMKLYMTYTSPPWNLDDVANRPAYWNVDDVAAAKIAMKNHLDQYNIAQYQNHAGVFAHQLTGEPAGTENFDPRNPSQRVLNLIEIIKYGVEYIKSLDPTHPVTVALDPAGAYAEGASASEDWATTTAKRKAWVNLFMGFCDFLDYHLYKYHNGGGAGDEWWRNPTVTRSRIVSMMDEVLIPCAQGKQIVIGETGCGSGAWIDWHQQQGSFTEQQQADYFKLFGEESKKRGMFVFIFKDCDYTQYESDYDAWGLFKFQNDGTMNIPKLAASLVKGYLSLGGGGATTTISQTSITTTSANLILNPSVESGTTSPNSWTSYITSAMTATVSWVSDAHTGSKAVRIDATRNSGVSVDESALWRQTLATSAGKTYRFRCWYKSSVTSNLILMADGSYNTQLSLLASSSWKQSDWLSVTVPSGASSLWADARLFNTATGYAVFDDFELVEVSTLTVTNTSQTTFSTATTTTTSTSSQTTIIEEPEYTWIDRFRALWQDFINWITHLLGREG